MKKYNNEALCFDDILLVPQHSDIKSRKDIDLFMQIGITSQIGMPLPIIAAPMDTVCEAEMATLLAHLGGMGSIHRYMPIEKQLEIAKEQPLESFFAIGATGNYVNHAKKLYDLGVRHFIVDTANGHSRVAISAVETLATIFYDAHIMAGNVSTWHGFKRLSDAGAQSVRVGIGGGSACTTRIVTGHGIPTLASVLEIAERRTEWDASIIADGGIRNSGDAVKAFAAGAHAVMLGSVLAGHDESPGEMITNLDNDSSHISNNLNGTGISQYKEFRGMASEAAQKHRGRLSVVEGISTLIPYKGSVIHTLQAFEDGLRSGCSYSGVDRLADISVESMYVVVSALSKGESLPHSRK